MRITAAANFTVAAGSSSPKCDSDALHHVADVAGSRMTYKLTAPTVVCRQAVNARGRCIRLIYKMGVGNALVGIVGCATDWRKH
jgi:hypothetical protein